MEHTEGNQNGLFRRRSRGLDVPSNCLDRIYMLVVHQNFQMQMGTLVPLTGNVGQRTDNLADLYRLTLFQRSGVQPTITGMDAKAMVNGHHFPPERVFLYFENRTVGQRLYLLTGLALEVDPIVDTPVVHGFRVYRLPIAVTLDYLIGQGKDKQIRRTAGGSGGIYRRRRRGSRDRSRRGSEPVVRHIAHHLPHRPGGRRSRRPRRFVSFGGQSGRIHKGDDRHAPYRDQANRQCNVEAFPAGFPAVFLIEIDVSHGVTPFPETAADESDGTVHTRSIDGSIFDRIAADMPAVKNFSSAGGSMEKRKETIYNKGKPEYSVLAPKM